MAKLCVICAKKATKACPCKNGIYYCGPEHQKYDWVREGGHKYKCRLYKLERIAKAKAKAAALEAAARLKVGTKPDTETKAKKPDSVPVERTPTSLPEADKNSHLTSRKGSKKSSKGASPAHAVKRNLRSERETIRTSDLNGAEGGVLPSDPTQNRSGNASNAAIDNEDKTSAAAVEVVSEVQKGAENDALTDAKSTESKKTDITPDAQSNNPDTSATSTAPVAADSNGAHESKSAAEDTNQTKKLEVAQKSTESEESHKAANLDSTITATTGAVAVLKDVKYISVDDLPLKIAAVLKTNAFSAYKLMEEAALIKLAGPVNPKNFQIPCFGDKHKEARERFYKPKRVRRKPHKRQPVQAPEADLPGTGPNRRKYQKTGKYTKKSTGKSALPPGAIFTTYGATDELQRQLRLINHPQPRQQQQPQPQQPQQWSERTDSQPLPPRTAPVQPATGKKSPEVFRHSDSHILSGANVASNKRPPQHSMPTSASDLYGTTSWGQNSTFSQSSDGLNEPLTQASSHTIPIGAQQALPRPVGCPRGVSQVPEQDQWQRMQQQAQQPQQQPRSMEPPYMQRMPQENANAYTSSGDTGSRPQPPEFTSFVNENGVKYEEMADGCPKAPPRKIFTTFGATHELQKQLRQLNQPKQQAHQPHSGIAHAPSQGQTSTPVQSNLSENVRVSEQQKPMQQPQQFKPQPQKPHQQKQQPQQYTQARQHGMQQQPQTYQQQPQTHPQQQQTYQQTQPKQPQTYTQQQQKYQQTQQKQPQTYTQQQQTYQQTQQKQSQKYTQQQQTYQQTQPKQQQTFTQQQQTYQQTQQKQPQTYTQQQTYQQTQQKQPQTYTQQQQTYQQQPQTYSLRQQTNQQQQQTQRYPQKKDMPIVDPRNGSSNYTSQNGTTMEKPSFRLLYNFFRNRDEQKSGNIGIHSPITRQNSANTGLNSANTGRNSTNTGLNSANTGRNSINTGQNSANVGLNSANSGVGTFSTVPSSKTGTHASPTPNTVSHNNDAAVCMCNLQHSPAMQQPQQMNYAPQISQPQHPHPSLNPHVLGTASPQPSPTPATVTSNRSPNLVSGSSSFAGQAECAGCAQEAARGMNSVKVASPQQQIQQPKHQQQQQPRQQQQQTKQTQQQAQAQTHTQAQQQAQPQAQPQQPILLVSGLSPRWTEPVLVQVLSAFGTVLAVTLYTRGENDGYAFATMDSHKSVEETIAALHRQNICGSRLSVQQFKIL